jgi:hypothetical protein
MIATVRIGRIPSLNNVWSPTPGLKRTPIGLAYLLPSGQLTIQPTPCCIGRDTGL